MRHVPLLAAPAAVLALGALLAAPSAREGTARPGEPQDAPPGTLMLTVGVNASGVSVLLGTRRADRTWTPSRGWETEAFRWRLRGAEGALLAEGGLDPARLCLDPEHAGQPPHVEGDRVVPHETHTNVRVPDVPFARVEFLRLREGAWVPFGSAAASAVPVR